MAVLMPKIEPAVTQLVYLVPDGISYIDLAKDLSIVNRRLYRQGMTYVVQDVQMLVNTGQKASDVSYLQFATAGNSWIVHNAWKKGFAAWREQTREFTDATGILPGKWNDFKIYLDDTHEDGTILVPYAGDGAAYEIGEWTHSKLVFDDDGTERELKMHLIGSSNLADTNNESGIGLIHEYARSRPRGPTGGEPEISAEASDTIWAKLQGTDEMTDMLSDNIEGDNDLAPYDRVEYPGGDTNADAAVPVRWLTANATQGMSNVPGFVVPCGLLKIEHTELALDNAGSADGVYASGTAPTSPVLITVASGPYRGVLAAPMGQ